MAKIVDGYGDQCEAPSCLVLASLSKRQPSDQMAVNGVCHRFKPIVSSEFLVDVMEMIAQCLRTDVECLGDMRSILPCCKHP